MQNVLIAGFLWKIRPLPGILQANRLRVAACPQNRGIILWRKLGGLGGGCGTNTE